MTSQCNPTPTGQQCITDVTKNALGCSPWEISSQTKLDCLANSYQQESLNIAGVNINLYRLLGVHEQTILIDLAKNGTPISGGDDPLYPAQNAFTTTITKWKSFHSGQNVLISSYIGYDFGEIKIPNDRLRYGIETNVRHHITTIRIKQGKNAANRVTKARVERSDDGTNWFGVAIIDLPDNDALNTIHFKHSVPNRYWRLRPLSFAGSDCDSWIIQALEMHDYSKTNSINIQDKILMENRDRDYDPNPITLKGYYDLQPHTSDLSRFGIELPISYQIKINFAVCVTIISRPIIVGDMLELPNEMQYTPDMTPIKKFLEVTDVAWDTSSYSPTWQPTMLLLTAIPALATQETHNIFNEDEGHNLVWQNLLDISDTIDKESKNNLPERGSDEVNVKRYFEPEEIQQADAVGLTAFKKLNYQLNTLYTEGALPPNGKEYTEGPTFPDAPKNGDYHRLTYEGLSQDVPARLHRWSEVKNRWIFMEADKRHMYNGQKAILNEYLKSGTRIAAKDIK